MRNVHERRISASADQVGAVLETLSSDDDQIWPGALWAPMVLDRGLEPGSKGGHDEVYYTVTAHEPGRLVEFTFDRPTGIAGTHALTVTDAGDGTTTVRHELVGRAYGPMVVLWPLVVRWAHDAVLEDAFDRAERSLGVGPAVPATWSPWIRLLRAVHGVVERRRQVREIDTPAELLAAAAIPRVDFADTFLLQLPPGASRDVTAWHRALVEDSTPGWVGALMAVRNVLARAMRLDTATAAGPSPFAALSSTDDTVVVGVDDHHLDFRGVLRVVDETLEFATVVTLNGRAGRGYFALVRPFHRRIVPAMLRRAARSHLVTAPAAGTRADSTGRR